MHICDYDDVFEYDGLPHAWVFIYIYAWIGIIIVYIFYILRAYLYIYSHIHTYTHTKYLFSTKAFWLQRWFRLFFPQICQPAQGPSWFRLHEDSVLRALSQKQIASNPTALGFQLARRSCQLGNHQNHQIHKFCALKITKSISMTHDIGLIWFGLIWFRGIATPNRKVQILLKVQKEW